MMLPKLALCAWAAGLLLAQPGISPPLVGVLVDERSRVLPVYGVRGNFLSGEPVVEGALSAAFSGRAGMVKTATEVLLLDEAARVARALAAPEGPALFAFDSRGEAALAYFPATRRLWDQARGEETGVPEGEVLAIAREAEASARLLMRREGQFWLLSIGLADGAIREQEPIGPAGSGPALMPSAEVLVLAEEAELSIRRAGESEILLKLPAPATGLALLGEGWIRIDQPRGAAPLALRLGTGPQEIYRLPRRDAER